MRPNTESDFWSHFDSKNPGECWEWGMSCRPNGYGQFRFEGKFWTIHRLAWVFVNGPIPDGIEILHKCDNPRCGNPDHLFAGTQADNMQDMVRKGRKGRIPLEKQPRGEKHGCARLSPEQVLEIRRKYRPRVYTQERLAAEYEVDQGHIHRIVTGKGWRHLNA